MKYIFMGLTLLSISNSNAVAQLEESPEKSCRCCSIDRYYAPWMKTLKRPKIRTHLGNASLNITTKSKQAQLYFNQGLNCLHGFWEFEAYRYFLAAIEEDPDCAMAYWGICMSLPGKYPEAMKERKMALIKATELSKNASKHEQYYIQSLDSLLLSGTKAASHSLEKIIREYPADMNAVGLLAYWQRDGHDSEGKPNPGTLKALEMLETGLKKNPQHVGLIHYYIHTIESGADFLKAKPYLKQLTEQGKDISHLVHMPSHIHFLSGDYSLAISAFQQCYALEKSYFEAEKITAIDQPNYSHNLHFWAMTLAEMGNKKEALRIAKLLVDSCGETKRDNITKAQNNYLAATIECYIHMRFKAYEKAAKSIQTKGLSPKVALYHYLSCLKKYCLIKHSINHPSDEAVDIFEAVESMNESYQKFIATSQNTSLASRENARAKMILDLFLAAAKIWQFNTDPNDMDISMVAFLLKDEDKYPYMEPPLLPYPLAEEVGDLCLKSKRPKDAINYYLNALKKRPKSIHLHRLLAQSYKVSGNKVMEKKYSQLVEASSEK